MMNKFLHSILTLFLLCIASSSIQAAGVPNNSLAPMLQKTLPAVVNIRAQIRITDINVLNQLQKEQRQNNNPGGVPDKFMSVGSGVIVDASKGYLLTNAHVVDQADRITVTLGDGRHYIAKIIGSDKPSDIALLQIPAKNLTELPLGNSNDIKVGDFVAAIGNPYGLSQSVTSGIVSALGRSTLGIENFENFIQIDASINPGNSGGALVNTQGQLIGINTAILAPDRGSVGIGFAIPSNMAKSVMQQLLSFGNVHRGILGVGAQDVSPELAEAFGISSSKGAAVTQVIPDSPAEKAGFQVGDVITGVNGTEIKNANDVVNAVGFMRVDSSASINIIRNKKPMTISAVLSDPKKRDQIEQQANPFLFGVSLKDFSLLSTNHGNILGVMAVAVKEGTNAWNSDLRPGDVIISANKQKITSIDQLQKIAMATKDDLLLNVLRGPGALFLIISKEA